MIMKATELMCGDLILCNDRPTRIYGIMERINRVYDTMTNDISMRRITPIPLTAEILEKNGWKQSVLHGRSNVVINSYWVLDSNGTHIEIKRNIMAVWLNYDNTNDVIYADYILPNPLAVHTLQHALRLCGLNDMADNFKI